MHKFSSKELAKHNKPSDLYVAIRENVYDITSFASKHPGGTDLLYCAAGKDVTQVFETYHKIGTVEPLLKKYKVGTLTESELPTFDKPSQFYLDLKLKVYGLLEERGKNSKNALSTWLRYIVIYSMISVFYYVQFYHPLASNGYAQILSAIVMGFFCAQVGLHPLHDASHAAITRSPFIWKVLGATHDFINGASHIVWCYQHVLGHHPYTNIADADPDIDVSLDQPDIRRILNTQTWFPRYAFQFILAPILYGLLAVKTRFQDVYIMYVAKRNGGIRVNDLTFSQAAIFWCGKAFFVLYRIVLPLYFTSIPLFRILVLMFISDLVSSYWLAFSFQVSHIVGQVDWPIPDKKNHIHQDWAAMQVRTTQDYAHDSLFWTWSTGALNYQAIHHVLPEVNQSHYPLIRHAFKQVCKEHGVKFFYKDTFVEAFSSHIGLLWDMGREPKKAE